MKVTELKPYSGTTKTKAFLNLETEEGMVVKGFTLVEGPNGLFLSMPSERGKDGKYYDRVFMHKDLRAGVQELCIQEYNKIVNGEENKNEIDNGDVPF